MELNVLVMQWITRTCIQIIGGGFQSHSEEHFILNFSTVLKENKSSNSIFLILSSMLCKQKIIYNLFHRYCFVVHFSRNCIIVNVS